MTRREERELKTTGEIERPTFYSLGTVTSIVSTNKLLIFIIPNHLECFYI